MSNMSDEKQRAWEERKEYHSVMDWLDFSMGFDAGIKSERERLLGMFCEFRDENEDPTGREYQSFHNLVYGELIPQPQEQEK